MRIEWSLLIAVAIPLGLGSLAGYMTRDGTTSAWYTSLRKPSWQPPGYLFGPVWTLLYVLMGVASWRVWKAGGGHLALAMYAVQLSLNIAWSFLFFRVHSLKWALLDIGALMGVLIATVSSFSRIDKVAGYLMMPYLAWVTFATALTVRLHALNA